ncbi:MAG: ATP-binding protein, partial [Actinomycetota bacterium]
MTRLHAAWANLPLRGKGLVVVALPVIALLVSVGPLFAAQRGATRAQAAARRVLQVRDQIRTVEVLLLEAETGIHGYVLARRERFLRPFSDAFLRMYSAIRRLQGLVGENPSQLIRAQRISFLTGQELELLAKLRDAYTDGVDIDAGARKGLLTRSNALMNQLGAVIADMRAEEERRLETRLSQVRRAQDRQRLASRGAVGIGLAGGLIAVLLFTTGVVRRVRRLSENAHRLVEDQPLLPLPPGDDEIGRLGRALGVAGTLLHEREHNLLEAKEEAERANQAKSEFLSRTSHELRTPLNATLGFAQLLGMRGLGEQERESVDQIIKAGQHLLELINDVLDIARIEAGGLTMVPVTLRAGDAVQEALDLVRPIAAGENIRLESEVDPISDTYIVADPPRFRQILLNLLSNAIKYNHPGGLVTLSYPPAPPGLLRIDIADTGLGIDADRLERLFTPFDRLGAETSTVEGTGLGLALSKRLAELMGGAMGVSSEPGHGSNFWVDVPLAGMPGG